MCSRLAVGLFIAIANLVIYAVGLIASSVLLVDKCTLQSIASNITSGGGGITNADENGLRILAVVVLAVCILMTIASGLLVGGLAAGRAWCMIPWMLLTVFSIIGNLIYGLVLLFYIKSYLDFILVFTYVVVQCLMLYPIRAIYQDIGLREQVKETKSRFSMQRYASMHGRR